MDVNKNSRLNNKKDVESRDLSTVDTSNWPHLEYPNADRPDNIRVPVIIKQSILNAIHQHGQESSHVEICGVLVGDTYQDEHGPFVYLEGSIRGDHAGSQVAQVTFTGETWNHIYEVLEHAWPEKRILAWYHTHPGFGIFLSGMDLFIHENFFSASEQMALVYDPLSGDEGLFLWQAGEPVRSAFIIEKDVLETPPRIPQRIDQVLTAASGEDRVSETETINNLATKVEQLSKRQNWIIPCLGFVILWLLLLSFFFPKYTLQKDNKPSPPEGILPRLPKTHSEPIAKKDVGKSIKTGDKKTPRTMGTLRVKESVPIHSESAEKERTSTSSKPTQGKPDLGQETAPNMNKTEDPQKKRMPSKSPPPNQEDRKFQHETPEKLEALDSGSKVIPHDN